MKHQPDFFAEDIVIPDIVQQKADEAFALIQKKGKSMAKKKQHRTTLSFKRQAAAVICVCVLAAGGITAAAAIRHFWSRGMQGAVQATPEQQQTLTDQGVAEVLNETPDYTALSVTNQSITVTPETVIVDNHFAHISFSVKGFVPGENAEPGFETISVYTGASPGSEDGWINSSASFYNGILADENGMPAYDDGTPLQYDENGGILPRYFDGDGSLEYILSVSVSDAEESLLGQTLHVELHNLGTVSKADFASAASGTWSFDLRLPSVSSSVTIPVQKPVDGTVFTIDSIELSPISARLSYVVNGDVVMSADDNGIPSFSGVVLKDGTRLPYLGDMGNSSYTDDSMSAAYVLSAFDRVIDPTQVASLLLVAEPGSGMVEVPLH